MTKSLKNTPKSSLKPAVKVYEQAGFFGSNEPAITKQSPPPPPLKKPFVPPLYQALDSGELRGNFMYLLRILINSANRQPNDPASQREFSNALLAELKIKRGLGSIDLETRSAILKTIKNQ